VQKKGMILRNDVLVEEVLAKCDVLKSAGLWPAEPIITPRAWLQNFDDDDLGIAAFLLDKFTFYNQRFSDALLVSSYNSIGDGLSKGPQAPGANDLIRSLSSAVLTPISGEVPNPTDSGFLMCRKARQILEIPEDKIVDHKYAIDHASNNGTVIFIDDFVGSGDQFLKTWERQYGRSNPRSFSSIQNDIDFTAIYITLVSTDFGLNNIHRNAPKVAVCVTHVLDQKSVLSGVINDSGFTESDVETFLLKYSARLQPKEHYIVNNSNYLAYGYSGLGLLFGFEHSIPDATLPIFWAPGINDWGTLVERH